MAKKPQGATSTDKRAYWAQQIEAAKKRWRVFWDAGDQVVDAYRMQKSDETDMPFKDKFNILYSSTETIRPNLYALRPSVRIRLRNRDTTKMEVKLAAQLLEGSLSYLLDEEDFDELMENSVEDLLLPGLGISWVSYEATLENVLDEDNNPVIGMDGAPQQRLLDEMVHMDYLYWQDFLTGLSRGWKTVPWVAKRVWLTKEKATKRFGPEKAAFLTYSDRASNMSRENNVGEDTAEAWEIWDKRSRTVYWFAESFPGDLLDEKVDPLRLKRFFPCPRPLRAISNTRSMVPRSLYSMYKSQQDTINTMTKRIRLLSEALRVVGIYDGSQAQLADILNPAAGNKMVKVDSWAAFAEKGGIKGSVDWLPIDTVVAVLVQLQAARETAKNEVYEITGFGDILRGASKASETLGAQNIKQNWASARLKKLQKEVQRFARDTIALAGELISEHCSPETIAIFSAVDIPSPQDIQTNPAIADMVKVFGLACQSLKNEARRVSVVDIETDSTIMADEEEERKDRMDFLGAAGAFLQQAVPAMESMPELGPLLGAMLMFTIRTFPASRPIEDEFEKVQKAILAKPQQQNSDPNGHNAKAQAATGVAQIKAQTEQQRIAAESQSNQMEMQAKQGYEMRRLDIEATAEQNRHNERMAEIMLERESIALKAQEVRIKHGELDVKRAAQTLNAVEAGHGAMLDIAAHNHGVMMDVAGHELEENKLDQEGAQDQAKDLTGGDT